MELLIDFILILLTDRGIF